MNGMKRLKALISWFDVHESRHRTHRDSIKSPGITKHSVITVIIRHLSSDFSLTKKKWVTKSTSNRLIIQWFDVTKPISIVLNFTFLDLNAKRQHMNWHFCRGNNSVTEKKYLKIDEMHKNREAQYKSIESKCIVWM